MKRAWAVAAVALAFAFAPRAARAIPIFAQRYDLNCTACHSVLPELNAFGTAFRNRGYRFDGVPRHGTTIAAIRYQVEYERAPAAGARRIAPAGALLSALEIGTVEAFLHENLGAAGGPAAPYLAYLAYADAHTRTLYRAGLFELPLAHSNGQRNDTLVAYGYEGTRVGLDDLLLAQPRWGFEVERPLGTLRAAATVAFATYGGSAYGGKPVASGTTSGARGPEAGVYLTAPLAAGATVGVQALAGTRAIVPSGAPVFADGYRRFGADLEVHRGRVDLLAQQWWGRDANGDGAGTVLGSAGGYVRVRYAPAPHAFAGVRYEDAATPEAARAFVWYAEALVTGHARLLLQWRRPQGSGAPQFGAALTVAAPWPRGR